MGSFSGLRLGGTYLSGKKNSISFFSPEVLKEFVWSCDGLGGGAAPLSRRSEVPRLPDETRCLASEWLFLLVLSPVSICRCLADISGPLIGAFQTLLSCCIKGRSGKNGIDFGTFVIGRNS